MLTSAMMLDHVGEQEKGARVRKAIDGALREDKVRTGDLGGRAGTKEFTQAVVARLRG
jgi:isocitrate dehydrogenase (NAD+)